MRFDPTEITDLADRCLEPTGDAVLDRLFDEYNESPAHARTVDEPGYYRFLYRLSKAYPGLTMVELGCKYGVASLHFLKGGGGYSTMVDCGSHCRTERFKDFIGHYLFAECKSTSDLAVLAVEKFSQRPDIVMIDTDHSQGTTQQEFEIWSKIVKPGGMILFDDIDAYFTMGREDFGCGLFYHRDLTGVKLHTPELHKGGWGFGIWFAPHSDETWIRILPGQPIDEVFVPKMIGPEDE